jgi:hypothetical protein
MIVKWEDEEGTSFFDYVVHVSKLNDEPMVKMTQATLDHNMIARDFAYGGLILLSDKGAIISQFDLGPKPPPVSEVN